MGVVYLAEDTRLSRRIALKAMLPNVDADARWRDRLRQEARAAAALSHPNIATIYSLDEIGDELYLASEYVSGPTLRALVESGSIPASHVVDIARQLARALVAAHAQGVVHRDLKPENIVRTTAGTIKVLDFGIARVEHLTSLRLSTEGTAAGTPAYMAPEQTRGELGDFKSDLFSFGVLIYELASGANPFEATTVQATTVKILEFVPPPLASAGRSELAALDGILTRCLSKTSAGRYESAAELLAALEELEVDGRSVRASESAVEGVRAKSPRWWWEFHQAFMSLLHLLMMYPVWRVRIWLTPPWGTLFVLAALACAATSVTMRLHLWFVSRWYPSELASERRRSGLWIRLSDAGLAAVLLAATIRLGDDHQRIAALFVTVAVASLLASFLIEPTTRRAAFAA
jgi:serine/threonine protein kinase